MIDHPDIKKFSIAGCVKDSGDLMKKQFHEEKRIKSRMKREGYLPVLDIVPLVATEYDQKKEVFYYTITMYGIPCDEDIKSKEGWLSGRWIMSTIKTK